jgi:hypothetical protein
MRLFARYASPAGVWCAWLEINSFGPLQDFVMDVQSMLTVYGQCQVQFSFNTDSTLLTTLSFDRSQMNSFYENLHSI